MPIRRTSNKSSQDTGFYNPEVYSDVGSRRIFEFDSNALTYINAVEAADGQALEFNVKTAYNAFVVGCKSDGIWDAIKASCIMVGARTLSGALVPLVGTAPTNNGPFVSGDYGRKTGLVGNGSTKYLNTNRSGNADPQNNQHLSIYVTAVNDTAGGRCLSNGADESGTSSLIVRSGFASSTRSQSLTAGSHTQTSTVGFLGLSRNVSSGYIHHNASINVTHLIASQAPRSTNFDVFRGSGVSSTIFSDSRLSFYSIGESLNLALLDNRVTVLMSGIQNAIP